MSQGQLMVLLTRLREQLVNRFLVPSFLRKLEELLLISYDVLCNLLSFPPAILQHSNLQGTLEDIQSVERAQAGFQNRDLGLLAPLKKSAHSCIERRS